VDNNCEVIRNDHFKTLNSKYSALRPFEMASNGRRVID